MKNVVMNDRELWDFYDIFSNTVIHWYTTVIAHLYSAPNEFWSRTFLINYNYMTWHYFHSHLFRCKIIFVLQHICEERRQRQAINQRQQQFSEELGGRREWCIQSKIEFCISISAKIFLTSFWGKRWKIEKFLTTISKVPTVHPTPQWIVK